MNHSIQPVTIPAQKGIQRDLVTRYSRDNKLILDEDLTGYDRLTVFYDVFFSSKLNKLMAIGPPLLNLKTELFPLMITVNGRLVSYRLEESFPKLFWLIIDYDLKNDEEWDLEFNFAGRMRRKVNIKRKHYNFSSILVTMQKSNRPDHIKDWAEHYYRKFNIQNVFIYDNNSNNINELKEYLPQFNYINWDFPFGIITSQPNKFAQRGALNHFLYRFTSNTQVFQFDIDELAFVKKTVKPKHHYYIKDFLINKPTVVHDNYSFRDYGMHSIKNRALRKYKYEKPNKRHHNKYICFSNDVRHLEVHYFTLYGTLLKVWLIRILWGSWKRFKRIEPLIRMIVFIVSMGKVVFLDYGKGRINHYRGITAKWRK